jgi:YcaO-like protein with predicted kinase domain
LHNSEQELAELCRCCGDEVQREFACKEDDAIAKISNSIGLSRLADVTGLDVVGIPTISAIRPNAFSLCVSQGKGATRDQARISAVMEAAELFFAERCKLFSIHGDLVEFGDAGLDTCRLRKNAQPNGAAELETLWLEGVDLISAKPAMVPLSAVSMDQRSSITSSVGAFAATSTGLAAGFSKNAVLLHALTEVIERDAHSLWRLAPTDYKLRTLVDHSTIETGPILNLIEKFRKAGYEPCFWDMTSETGVPVFMAEFYARDDGGGFYWAYSVGTGCDVLPERALQKAILEAAQIRLTYIAGARDDLNWSDYSNKYESIAANRRKLSTANLPKMAFVGAGDQTKDSDEVLAQLLAKLKGLDISNVTAIDLAKNRDDIEVYKILVPGLEDCTEEKDGPLSDRGIVRLDRMVQRR